MPIVGFVPFPMRLANASTVIYHICGLDIRDPSGSHHSKLRQHFLNQKTKSMSVFELGLATHSHCPQDRVVPRQWSLNGPGCSRLAIRIYYGMPKSTRLAQMMQCCLSQQKRKDAMSFPLSQTSQRPPIECQISNAPRRNSQNSCQNSQILFSKIPSMPAFPSHLPAM